MQQTNSNSASSFYQTMRSAFASSLQPRPGPQQPHQQQHQYPPSDSRSGFYAANAASDANRRLSSMGLRSPAANSNQQQAAIPPGAPTAYSPATHGAIPPHSSVVQPRNEEPSWSGQLPAVGGSSIEDDETLTQDELRALRVVELACPVSVSYGEVTSANASPPSSMRLLAEEATIKIYPRHVFLCRTANGSPVAEIVIAELSELSEDEEKGSLSFYLKKSGGDGGLTVVEITCAEPHSRSAIYKLVCSRRSWIEDEQ